MKKILIAVCTIFIAAVAAFYLWLSRPSVEDPTLLNTAVASARKRLAQLQREAGNPRVNGYLAEDFLPLWGAEGLVNDDAEVTQAVLTWARKGGPEADHAAHLAGGDSEYLAARKEFEKYLPSLLEELDKPLFTVPQNEGGAGSTAPSANNMRELAQALAGYAKSKAAEKQYGDAVEPLARLFSLGAKMQGRETILHDMVGITIHRAAFQALGAIPGDAPLSTTEWLELATSAEQAIPPRDLLKRALESEINVRLSNVATMKNQAASEDAYLSRAVLAREKRILMNQLAEQLRAQQEGRLSGYSPPESNFVNQILGRSGVLNPVPAQDLIRAADLMEINRRCLLGTAVVLDLRAFRSKNGENPDSLDRLLDMGLQPPREDVEYDAETGTLLVPLSPSIQSTLKPDNITVKGWSEVTKRGLLLHV